jgi:hypothetical protein
VEDLGGIVEGLGGITTLTCCKAFVFLFLGIREEPFRDTCSRQIKLYALVHDERMGWLGNLILWIARKIFILLQVSWPEAN